MLGKKLIIMSFRRKEDCAVKNLRNNIDNLLINGYNKSIQRVGGDMYA